VTSVDALSARFRALSQRERLLLLACAAAVLAFALVRLAAYPAVESYRKARAAIPQRQSTLLRYSLAAQGEEKIDEAFADAGERLEALEEGILPGDNPAAAGSALQGILKPWVQRADTRVTSVRALTPVQKGGYAEVAVQMDLQTTTEGLAALLAEVPRHQKVLRVKKLSVSSGYFGAAASARKENLVVSIAISGIANTAFEQKGERAEE
jgi:type II secretory pathway component PulM